MVNRPGILAAAGAGGQATHHHIRGLIEGLGCDRGWIGDIPEAHLSSGEIGDDFVPALETIDAAALAGEGDHLVAPLHQFFHHKAADVARGSEHHHAHLFGWSAAVVVAEGHR